MMGYFYDGLYMKVESMEGVWFWFQSEEYIKSVAQLKSLDSLNWNKTLFLFFKLVKKELVEVNEKNPLHKEPS
jgi:hypothetical protein